VFSVYRLVSCFFSAPLNRGVVTGGFDLVYDCVADAHTTTDALRWTRAGGKVVMVGSHLAPMPHVDLTPVWYDHIDLVGTYGHGMDEWGGVRRHTYEWVFDLFRQGRVGTDGLITHRFPFSEYKQAIQLASSKGRQQAIKVMLQAD